MVSVCLLVTVARLLIIDIRLSCVSFDELENDMLLYHTQDLKSVSEEQPLNMYDISVTEVVSNEPKSSVVKE